MRRLQLSAVLLLMPLVLAGAGRGEEPAKEESDPRMAYMRQMIDEMSVRPTDPGSELNTQFERTAILRFGDPTRDASDGAIWKLGSSRPQVIVAMEFTRYENSTQLNYEFLSLTDEKFELQTDRGWRWTPSGSVLKWQKFEGAPPPHESPVVRLRQMKTLARRFSASETYRGDRFELRLMPQPIDRYSIGDGADAHTGGIFAFANGTNPEVLLILESKDAGWQFGLARLCGAAPTVKLKDEVVWTRKSMDDVGKSWRLPYTGDAHEVEGPVSEGRKLVAHPPCIDG